MLSSRNARPTLSFVDEYCQLYQSLFAEVRSFETFKYLHLGLISDIKRKSLPAIAKAVGVDDPQSLYHFLSESLWSIQQFRQARLKLILELLKGGMIIVLQPLICFNWLKRWLGVCDPAIFTGICSTH